MKGLVAILLAAALILGLVGWSIAEGAHECIYAHICELGCLIGAILCMFVAAILNDN